MQLSRGNTVTCNIVATVVYIALCSINKSLNLIDVGRSSSVGKAKSFFFLNYYLKYIFPIDETSFIRPSSDGTYCGMVMSVRPCPRPSVRPSQFSALFSYMIWPIELKFCVWCYINVRKINFEWNKFSSIFEREMTLLNFKLLHICSFPHFSSTCFDTLSWNFVYDFVLMYHRSSLSVVISRQFWKELCLFLNFEYRKYAVFRTFLLHALTYWAEKMYITFFLMYHKSSYNVVTLRQFSKELYVFLN